MKSKVVEQVKQKPQDSDEEIADDLELLVFGGNAEMPANLLDHLPAIGVQKSKKIEFEIFDDEILDDDEERTANKINAGPYPDIKTLIETARVLLVDDEPYNIDALKIVLQCSTSHLDSFKGENFRKRLDTASNGMKAVSMVKKRWLKSQQSFALILMDCNMPKMDGYQATQQIREFINEMIQEGHQVKQPVILGVSGHLEETYVQRGLNSGMDRVIGKPASVENIQEAIQGL